MGKKTDNMNIGIKRAEKKDLKHIAKLFDAYRVFYKQQSNFDLAQDFINERFKKSESVIFYAIDEANNYLGFTQLYPGFSSVSAQRTWVLNDLYVDSKCRNCGIGSMLLDKAKQFAIETQSKGIALETAANNVRAQKLYESLGYIKDSEISYFLKI
jgi:ribosomal protein S18 acetylase RimI-like enzyme